MVKNQSQEMVVLRFPLYLIGPLFRELSSVRGLRDNARPKYFDKKIFFKYLSHNEVIT